MSYQVEVRYCSSPKSARSYTIDADNAIAACKTAIKHSKKFLTLRSIENVEDDWYSVSVIFDDNEEIEVNPHVQGKNEEEAGARAIELASRSFAAALVS